MSTPAAYLFNLGAILGAWLSLTTDPLGSEPAWSHDPVRP